MNSKKECHTQDVAQINTEAKSTSSDELETQQPPLFDLPTIGQLRWLLVAYQKASKGELIIHYQMNAAIGGSTSTAFMSKLALEFGIRHDGNPKRIKNKVTGGTHDGFVFGEKAIKCMEKILEKAGMIQAQDITY